jgi:hypothetical protein
MKVGISILIALAFGLAGTALADRYDALGPGISLGHCQWTLRESY